MDDGVAITIAIACDGDIGVDMSSNGLSVFLKQMSAFPKRTFPGGELTFNVENTKLKHDGDLADFLGRVSPDVIFLIGQESTDVLDEADLTAVHDLMEAGVGLFGTGDHDTLGNRLCGRIQHLKSMRSWDGKDTLPGTDTVRDTRVPADVRRVIPGQLESEPPGKQIFPTFRLYGESMLPHPVMSTPLGVIRELPDHQHEGYCREESGVKVLARSMTLPGQDCHKRLLDALSYAVVAVKETSNGRIATDSTFHHFLNLNTRPVFADPSSAAAIDLSYYYFNLVLWLYTRTSRRAMSIVGSLARAAHSRDPSISEALHLDDKALFNQTFASFVERELSLAWQYELALTMLKGIGEKESTPSCAEGFAATVTDRCAKPVVNQVLSIFVHAALGSIGWATLKPGEENGFSELLSASIKEAEKSAREAMDAGLALFESLIR